MLENFVRHIGEFEPILDSFKSSLKNQFSTFDTNTKQLAQRLWIDFDDLGASTENNPMDDVINLLTFDLFKKGCQQLVAPSGLGTAIFITDPKSALQAGFIDFEFIDDLTAFKQVVKYQ